MSTLGRNMDVVKWPILVVIAMADLLLIPNPTVVLPLGMIVVAKKCVL
jgi:hypothetical protein